MAINLKTEILPRKSKQISKGKIPTKNYINILAKKQKTFSVRRNLPLLILIALLVLAFAKFLIYDPVVGTIKEANRLSAIQEELIEVNTQIEGMKETEDAYSHYTTSGMTAEELGQVDRVSAMRLVEDAFLHGNISRSWNLTGNVMTLEVTGKSLKDLNRLATNLEENSIVQRCVISSANKHMDATGNVVVTFTIYLQEYGE